MPASSPGEVEQVGRELRQPRHLLDHRLEKLLTGRFVEVLVAKQLEEAAERENRRPQLVRGVGDELTAGVVDAGQAQTHPVEGPRQLPELVPAVIDDRLVEIAGGNALGSAFQPPNPASEHGCGAKTRNQGHSKCREARPEEAGLDEVDVLERRSERRGEEKHVAAAVGDRHLGVFVAVPSDAPAPDPGANRRRPRHRIPLHVLRQEQMGRIEDGRNDAPRKRPEVHDPRVGPAGGLVDDVLAHRRPCRLSADRAGRRRELCQPPVHEPALQSRDEGDPDDRQRAEHDDGQRETQPRSDAPERIHPRNR